MSAPRSSRPASWPTRTGPHPGGEPLPAGGFAARRKLGRGVGAEPAEGRRAAPQNAGRHRQPPRRTLNRPPRGLRPGPVEGREDAVVRARARFDRRKRRDRDTRRDAQGHALAAAGLLEAPLTPLCVAARVLGDEQCRGPDLARKRERLGDDVARPQDEARAARVEARVEVTERFEQERNPVRPRERAPENRLVEDEQRHDPPRLVRRGRECGVVVHA